MESNNAVKFIPKNSGPSFKDGDGDDGEIVLLEKIEVSSVSNGWVIHSFYENGDEFVEVFDTDGTDDGNRQAVQCIIESMGLDKEIKVK